MKSVWITNPSNTWPSWSKAHAVGALNMYFPTRVYVPDTTKYIRNDRQLTSSYKSSVQSQGFEYRLYRDPSWDSIANAQVLADSARDDIFHVLQAPGYIPYMFDIEYHAPQFILDTFKAFRVHFPKGPVAWTLEPFQAGWFTQALIDFINKDPNFVVVVQNFYYNMSPAGTRNGLTPRQELVKAGIADNRAKTFYDALKLPAVWDGSILSNERLP